MKCDCCGQELPVPTTSRFNEFWQIYPIKEDRKQCAKKWNTRKLDNIADKIISAVIDNIEHNEKWKAGFIPHPKTYINGDKWDDELPAPGTVAIKWPTTNEGWGELGKKHNINAGMGEEWPKFKGRVRAAVEGIGQ